MLITLSESWRSHVKNVFVCPSDSKKKTQRYTVYNDVTQEKEHILLF